MALKPSQRGRYRKPHDTELNVIPAMSLMVILIPFLLLTAVFGKATILNLFLPTEEESSASSPPSLNELIPTVAITGNGFILGKGKGKVERISLKNNFHDFSELRGHLLELRKEQGVSKSIIILPEAGIRYQLLISTMDICRQYKDEDGTIHALFPIISLGEYQATIAQKS